MELTELLKALVEHNKTEKEIWIATAANIQMLSLGTCIFQSAEH